MRTVYLSLGSNLGDGVDNLARAGALVPGVASVSSIYRTAPQGRVHQPDFFNAVVAVETDMTLLQLLRQCQRVEQLLGRVRFERWGPRTIDIDLVLSGAETVESTELVVPHPRLMERAFVLIPLLELVPEAVMPDGTRLREAVLRVSDQGVERFLDATAFLARIRALQ